ncbi:structural maintenance of chromosomes protein 1-like [Iris pallida]|uniref:Structural maintenance of chromosomes protein 1-like n=1 Tax=Iris pallida TaxID=29817 RepID=A0AAX6GTV9_IRIPA|nr:structural maintenance of chromosomes protein 1-like [Iris pallida]
MRLKENGHMVIVVVEQHTLIWRMMMTLSCMELSIQPCLLQSSSEIWSSYQVERRLLQRLPYSSQFIDRLMSSDYRFEFDDGKSWILSSTRMNLICYVLDFIM